MKRFPDRCPHYQGVCGLDESYTCFCSSNYLTCKIYKQKERNEIEKFLREKEPFMFEYGNNTGK